MFGGVSGVEDVSDVEDVRGCCMLGDVSFGDSVLSLECLFSVTSLVSGGLCLVGLDSSDLRRGSVGSRGRALRRSVVVMFSVFRSPVSRGRVSRRVFRSLSSSSSPLLNQSINHSLALSPPYVIPLASPLLLRTTSIVFKKWM
jgi:hypothetical protein